MKDKSLYQNIEKSINEVPFDTALYYQGTKISFAKLGTLINKAADVLVNRFNIKPGDIVLLAQPNIPHVIILFYALNKIGAIVNLVHPFTPYNQIISIFKKTNTKVAFMFEQRIAKEVHRYRELSDKIVVTRVEDFLPLGKRIIYHAFMNVRIRKKLGNWRGSFKGFNYFVDYKPTGKTPATYEWNNDETSILLHSGSTTGEPKTICLSNNNFNSISDLAEEFLGTHPDNLRKKGMLSVLPSFHGFGLCMTMHTPLANKVASVLIPKFSPKEVVKAMDKITVAAMCGVPTMYEKLLGYEDFRKHRKLKDLHVAFCGGDSLPDKVTADFNSLMETNNSKCRLFEGYGLTEAVAVNVVNTFKNNKPGSLGKPMSSATFTIVDENDNEVPTGEIGEITIKSPAVMNSYFKDEENTAKALRNGLLHTGDLGYKDEDGFIFFAQRKKRVVKVSGVGVFPTEVERLIEHIPGVKKCCAIEIPDPVLQHAIKVFVVADYFEEEGKRQEILETCQKYLIKWSVPKEIEFRKELPITMIGKVDFKVLQQEEDAKRGVIR